MKKIISLLVIAALLCAVACFGACSGGKKTAEDQTTAAAPSAAFAGVFSLTADKDAVAPGDTVTVTLRAENCENVACFDVEMTSSENASLTDYKEKDVGELITTLSETTDGVVFSGIVATTTDIAAADLATFTYTVSADAAAGDTITLKAVSSQFLIGTDDSGDTTADVTDSIVIAPLTIPVHNQTNGTEMILWQ